MAGALPVRINPFRLAEQGACIEGLAPIGKMFRLGETLLSRQGEAKIRLKFSRDAGGLNVVEGAVRAQLVLRCQRCLEAVKKPVDRRFRLVMVHNEAEASRLQPMYELLEIADETVFITDMIEDELLLSVPLIPTHDDPMACDAAMLQKIHRPRADPDDDRLRAARNPFAALKDLKKD